MMVTFVIIHLLKPIECAPPRVNPIVSYGLWVIITCLYKFIHFNKCTTPLRNIDSGGGYACVEARNSVLFAQFVVNLKLLLKIKSIKNAYINLIWIHPFQGPMIKHLLTTRCVAKWKKKISRRLKLYNTNTNHYQ